MDVFAELEHITDEIMALGEQIEAKRKRAMELAGGMIATERRGATFRVDRTRISPGVWRLFLEGPALKKDGTPHARNTCMSPVGLLHDLRPAAE